MAVKILDLALVISKSSPAAPGSTLSSAPVTPSATGAASKPAAGAASKPTSELNMGLTGAWNLMKAGRSAGPLAGAGVGSAAGSQGARASPSASGHDQARAWLKDLEAEVHMCRQLQHKHIVRYLGVQEEEKDEAGNPAFAIFMV